MEARVETAGFTLIELLVVIAIMGILLTVGIFAQRNLQSVAADNERGDDVASIARRLEQAYANQEIGAPSYPSTKEFAADAKTRTRTLDRISADALTAPGGATVSVVGATSATNPPSPDPTTTTYVYQPLTRDGSLCTADPSAASASSACVRFVIYYLTETDDQVKTVMSMHQQ